MVPSLTGNPSTAVGYTRWFPELLHARTAWKDKQLYIATMTFFNGRHIHVSSEIYFYNYARNISKIQGYECANLTIFNMKLRTRVYQHSISINRKFVRSNAHTQQKWQSNRTVRKTPDYSWHFNISLFSRLRPYFF